MSFYNTINVSGQQLIDYEESAQTQEEQILKIFLRHSKVSFAWFEIKNILNEIPEISIKRSITNLKTKGKLIKTTDKVTGSYGKPCYKYKLI